MRGSPEYLDSIAAKTDSQLSSAVTFHHPASSAAGSAEASVTSTADRQVAAANIAVTPQ